MDGSNLDQTVATALNPRHICKDGGNLFMKGGRKRSNQGWINPIKSRVNLTWSKTKTE